MLLCLLAVFAATTTGCFGEFALTRKVYTWNDDVSDNNFVKTLVFWGLNVIPVYGIASFADLVIFNLIEFWTGSNPIAMADGETESQIVEYDGKLYELKATKNHFSVTEITEGSDNFTYVYKLYEESQKIVLQTETSEFVVSHIDE